MLVLSRRIDEAIIIGENILIRIVEIRGGEVKLGIEAPRNIMILREEMIKPKPVRREEKPEPEVMPVDVPKNNAPKKPLFRRRKQEPGFPPFNQD